MNSPTQFTRFSRHTDPSWSQYPNTILEIGSDAVLRVDLRKRLLPKIARELGRLGLGAHFAVITPVNPLGWPSSREENARRVLDFQEYVKQRGWLSLPVVGCSPDDGHREDGLALAVPRTLAKQIAVRCGQSAFFWYDDGEFWLVGALVECESLRLPIGALAPEFPGLRPGLVETLRAIGRGGAPAIPPMLSDRDLATRYLMVGERPWLRVAERLHAVGLREILTGMLIHFSATQFQGGSVTPTLQVFRRYHERFRAEAEDFFGWSIANGYGTRSLTYRDYPPTVRTYQEAQECDALQQARKNARVAQERLRQSEFRRAKVTPAKLRLRDVVRRGDLPALKALVAKHALDLRSTDPDAAVLLEVAKENGRERVVQYLLDEWLSTEPKAPSV